MFCSAMPTWKKRSGNSWAKGATSVYLDRSAESTTISGRSWPRATMVWAKGASTRGAADGVVTAVIGGLDAGTVAVIRPPPLIFLSPRLIFLSLRGNDIDIPPAEELG